MADDLTDRSERTRARRAGRLQMVFQDPQSALNPRRRIASIVTQAMEAGSRHASWDKRLARTRELLAEVGLSTDIGPRLPGQLSGGQRQRVNIARALCNIPKILVADEIVSGLDVSIQAQLLNLAGAAARGTRIRHAVYLARPFGRPSFVLPRAGDVSRRNCRTGPNRRGILKPAASAYPRAGFVGATGRSIGGLARTEPGSSERRRAGFGVMFGGMYAGGE